MTDYYHCNICDESMLLKSAKKHIQSRKHQYLAQSYEYVEFFENVNIENVDSIYNNFIKEHNRRFRKYTVQCQFNFHFDNCLPGISSCLINNDKKFVIGNIF